MRVGIFFFLHRVQYSAEHRAKWIGALIIRSEKERIANKALPLAKGLPPSFNRPFLLGGEPHGDFAAAAFFLYFPQQPVAIGRRKAQLVRKRARHFLF